jgi:hypothetical protein
VYLFKADAAITRAGSITAYPGEREHRFRINVNTKIRQCIIHLGFKSGVILGQAFFYLLTPSIESYVVTLKYSSYSFESGPRIESISSSACRIRLSSMARFVVPFRLAKS